MTGILDLPAELIVHIVDFLAQPEDVFNSRLANKDIEGTVLSYFGKRFFRKKGYLITTPSINVLKSIANHPELRKHVQHVWFNPDCYTFASPKCAPESLIENGKTYDQEDKLSEEDKKKWHAFKECVSDHGQLISRPRLAEELADAFSKLPILAAVGMRRSEDHSPWGWMRLKGAIGEDPRVLEPIPSGPKYMLQGPTKLFIAMMKAIADSDAGVKRLYTDIVEIDNILPETLPQETLDRACRSLLYLEFNATKAWVNKSPARKYTTARDESSWGEGVLRLFKAAPHLLELGLQIFPDLRQSHLLPPVSRNPESWKKAYPYLVFDKLTNNAPLQHLTRLKLEKLTVTPELLEAFLSPSKSTLTSLKLREIRLLSTEDLPEPWYQIFTFLQTIPNLNYLLLYHLMHSAGGIAFNENAVPETEGVDSAQLFTWGVQGKLFFTDYENIVLEAQGREEVEEKLEKVASKHWYQRPLNSYEMDEGVWHTDTSDEEW